MLLTEALQIPPSARCICAVGAGGKRQVCCMYWQKNTVKKESVCC